LLALPALAGGDHNGIVADMGPRDPQQIAKPQSGMRREINSVCNLWRA